MKNKIVKALVLASIVSMTATGAAGLTFADENVATGDTATSTTDTATKKTVDDLEADLTAAQKTADKKNEDFTEKLAAYTDAKKAVADVEASVKKKNELQEKLNSDLGKFEDKSKNPMVDAVQKTNQDIEAADTTGLTTKQRNVLQAYKNCRQIMIDPTQKYEQAVMNYVNLENYLQEHQGEQDAPTAKTVEKALVDAKKAFDDAKADLEEAYGDAADILNAFDYVPADLSVENTRIQGYEQALENLVSSKKAILELETNRDALETALTKATTELKTATEAYKKALTDLGTAKSAYEEATADLVQIYRLYHPTTHEHLWTKDANEKKVLSTERGWIYEGVAWLTKKKGTDAVPLYRLVYPFSGDHHYTTSENEVKDLTTKYGWISEDVAFYVPKEGDVPVYRLFNPGLKMGAHHFTTGENEYNTLGERGWTKENVAYKVSAKGALDTSEIKTEDSRIAEAEKIYAGEGQP